MNKKVIIIVALLTAIMLIFPIAVKGYWQRLNLLNDSASTGFVGQVRIVHDNLENVNCYIAQSSYDTQAGIGIFCMKAEK
jgi:hypothetical protein